MIHSFGSTYVRKDGSLVMLVQTGPSHTEAYRVCLMGLNNGNRMNDPIVVKGVPLNEGDWFRITDGKPEEYTPVKLTWTRKGIS